MRPKKFEKYSKLEIEWVDILDNNAWQDEVEVNKVEPIKVKTIGYFLRNNKKSLIIAHSVCEDSSCDTMAIPFGVIKNINILGVNDGSRGININNS